MVPKQWLKDEPNKHIFPIALKILICVLHVRNIKGSRSESSISVISTKYSSFDFWFVLDEWIPILTIGNVVYILMNLNKKSKRYKSLAVFNDKDGEYFVALSYNE